MPIPNSNRKIGDTISLTIENETIIAGIDLSTRFSYVKRSAARDLNLSYVNSLLLLQVIYKNNAEYLIFEIRDELKSEIIIGKYAASILKINGN